jgi:cysteinyl-tRNA synthetase
MISRSVAIRLLAVALLGPCASCANDVGAPLDYRNEMRAFVREISGYARERMPGFIVIPQNGSELATLDGEPDGRAAADYLLAVDGIGQEDLLYGYSGDDLATPADATDWTRSFLDVFAAAGKRVLVIDYCSTPSKVDDSQARNAAWGFVPFPAHRRALDAIPSYPASPIGANSATVHTLAEAANFLYLINPSGFADKASFVAAVAATNYDLAVVDAFFRADEPLAASDVEAMRSKANGGRRLVICYMSIGEAEDYRWYWHPSWYASPPEWLGPENPSWEGNYKVRYWLDDWKRVIYGGPSSYLDRILAAGFDGVYLDIIDAFEYWEQAR